MTRVVLALVCLTLVYALALASFDPWDLLLGAVLSGLVLAPFRSLLFRGPSLGPREVARRLLALPRLVLAVVRDIIAGTWLVAGIVLGFRRLSQPGIVAIPFGERTPSGVVVTGFITTLAPGEYLVDIDWERRLLLIHAIDARSPDDVRARYEDFYRRFQRPVVP